MATILLSAAGAAVGAGFGGTVLGLSGAIIGRAVGATLGRAIDQKVLGGGSDAVEVGRLQRFRVMGASEGAAIPRVWGRVRVAGQVIWASRFQENMSSSGGGKGTSKPTTKEYTYSVSLAVAVCEGTITCVGRVWADGNEIEPDALNIRVYSGDEAQLPDPKIQAVEGIENAPSYRGTAYIVIEDLDLTPFGNRVPQFSFEVIRAAQGASADKFPGLSKVIPGVCLIPGTGEYALATTPVHYNIGPGMNRSANVNSTSGKTDFASSLDHLTAELPSSNGVSLVVSWFGNDLRCGLCSVRPKVEQRQSDGAQMPWRVSGLSRVDALEVAKLSGEPVYGGSPADQSVVEAIQALNAAGKAVTFYPFLLMEQLAGNGLTDPWTGLSEQSQLPWRGRITLNNAPGRPGTTDRTAAAAAEVAGFFGTVMPSHFAIFGETVTYSGPEEWSYRRFILHYANLCAAAGGVSAFCIGSEMRGLTQVRGASDSFPTVVQLRQLVAEVRAILGTATKISYASDWSEYFGYHVDNHVYFHLDELWADPEIDFIGIDNYMPLSDWRDGDTHLDSAWGSQYNIDYLRANIAGGEGFDWYYGGPTEEIAQVRRPIEDGAHGENWVFRFKDIKGWWSSSHHNRINGVRDDSPTPWIAGSKPIRFTEFGCAAIDKGTNQPNVFLDPKSSESMLPKYSNGTRDDFLQLCYFHAMYFHWADPDKNPTSNLYSGQMVDFQSSLAWAWDARPFPAFPGNIQLWSDGPNYDKGHWLNGRSSGETLAAVIDEVCQFNSESDLELLNTKGIVRGFSVSEVTSPRAAMQNLISAYPTDVFERDGKLHFQARSGNSPSTVNTEKVAVSSEVSGLIERTRSSEAEVPSKLRLSFLEAEGDFTVATASAGYPNSHDDVVSQSELSLVLTPSEAAVIAERWIAEARVALDTARFALPRSMLDIGVGDTVDLEGQYYRVDRLEQSDAQLIEAVRIDRNVYEPAEITVPARGWSPYLATVPVYPLFLDLPLLKGTEVEHAPHACVTANPWPGPIAVWSSVTDDAYSLNKLLTQSAQLGVTETAMNAAESGLWDRGPSLRLRLETGILSSVSELSLLSGANIAAIGDGTSGNWEVFQFANANLVAPKTFEVSLRLRGQAGTDGLMPSSWPIGSIFVVISDALQQLDLPLSSRGLERFYRFGPSDKGYSNANSVLLSETFDGVGLRPYSVVHLKTTKTANDIIVNWIRRTRVDGDNWQSLEVPLGEDNESYLVQIKQGATVVRAVNVNTPTWTYSASMQALDGVFGSVTVEVAQVSQRFGSGPLRSVVSVL